MCFSVNFWISPLGYSFSSLTLRLLWTIAFESGTTTSIGYCFCSIRNQSLSLLLLLCFFGPSQRKKARSC